MADATELKDKDFKYLVRVINTDLDGNKRLMYALSSIKGIGYMLANAICEYLNLDKMQKVGYLDDSTIKKIEETIKNIDQLGLPSWLLNRRADPETGEDKHLIATDLDFTRSNDIKKLMKMKAYRGVRHSLGLPVRGQRTKSNFRKSKSKGKGGSLGVQRKKKK